jgi:hypothetical protein
LKKEREEKHFSHNQPTVFLASSLPQHNTLYVLSTPTRVNKLSLSLPPSLSLSHLSFSSPSFFFLNMEVNAVAAVQGAHPNAMGPGIMSVS